MREANKRLEIGFFRFLLPSGLKNKEITDGFLFRSVVGFWSGHAVALQAGMVAGSIPDGVFGSFHWHNPSGRTMALGPTQPLTEMSTRNISWGVKAAGA